MIRLPDKIKRYFFLPFLLALTMFCLGLTSEAVYADDLVLSGDTEMVIENTTYTQTGNIYINDNAKLTIENATLILNGSYHEEFMIYVQGSGTLEVINSTVKTSLENEVVIIDFWGSSNLIFQDSNLSEGLVYLQYFGSFQGNASISNSNLQDVSFTLTPSGAGTISISNSSCNSMTLRFDGNYEGEFSDLRPGFLGSWSYVQNGYNITFQNTTINNYVVACDGPAQIVVRNSVIHQFAPNSAQSLISMTAIDSTLIQVPLHGLHDITASFWGLKSGLHADWILSDHCSGDFLPNVNLQNTTVQLGWSISGFQNSNLSIDDSTVVSLRFYGNNANISTTNSTANELMLYNATNSTLTIDNTVINAFNVYVPPNSLSIAGNVTFPETAGITNWVSPSTVHRNYPVFVKDSSGSVVSGVALDLYSDIGTLVWSGTTDAEGKADFTIDFNDDNYLGSWILQTTYLGASKGQKEVGLLTSTPIEILFWDATPSVTEGTIGTQITFSNPTSGFGTKKGKVLIGGVAAKIAKDGWTDTLVTATVSKAPPAGTHDVTIKPYKATDITLSSAFTVKPPEIDSLDSYHGAPGASITITGNFFSTKKGKVYLGDQVSGKRKNCKVTSWGMDSITFVVPKTSKSFPAGTYLLDVVNKIGVTEASSGFTID